MRTSAFALKLAFAFASWYLSLAAGNSQYCVGPHSPLPNGTLLPCGPGNEQCPPGNTDFAFTRGGARYHIRDESCGLNDPNGPFYDPNHGIYHLFYQDHLGEGGLNVVWGHVASHDLLHWARLPVALWNDQPYDNSAIFTGSATIVDGEVVLVYPGLCNPSKTQGCLSGRNLALAAPANASDPLLKIWTKRGVIVNASNGNQSHPDAKPDDGKDPSAAWRTADGEWRFVTGGVPIVYGSVDFKSWYEIGIGFNNNGGDCPSFFEIPPTTPGAITSLARSQPTHVHMVGGGVMRLGWYTEGPRRSVGNWTDGPIAWQRKADRGKYYATKDFWDPVKGRRLLWGWAVPPLNAQTLPREVTWNPQLEQLCYAPIEEQAGLRGEVLSQAQQLKLTAGEAFVLQTEGKPWKSHVGNQSEIVVTFRMPPEDGLFGLVVMADMSPYSSGTVFFVDFKTETSSVTVGAMSNRSAASGQYRLFNCQDAGVQCANDTLRLTARDENITLRVFVDNNFAECYWQENRVAMTEFAPPNVAAAAAIFANIDVEVSRVDAWRVKDIWISPDEVLRASVARKSSMPRSSSLFV